VPVIGLSQHPIPLHTTQETLGNVSPGHVSVHVLAESLPRRYTSKPQPVIISSKLNDLIMLGAFHDTLYTSTPDITGILRMKMVAIPASKINKVIKNGINWSDFFLEGDWLNWSDLFRRYNQIWIFYIISRRQ
jgi:hypothetical protein